MAHPQQTSAETGRREERAPTPRSQKNLWTRLREFQRKLLEVEDEATDELEIVLVLAEEAGADVIRFETETEARTPPVVGAAAEHHRERVSAITGSLRLLVQAAHQAMQPGFPNALAPGDFGPGGVGQELDVLIVGDRRSEGRADAALKGEPVVGEIAERRIDADRAGVEDRRAEAIPGDAETELPAEIIASTEDKARLGIGGDRFGRSRKRRAAAVRRGRGERGGIEERDSRGGSVGEIDGRRSG